MRTAAQCRDLAAALMGVMPELCDADAQLVARRAKQWEDEADAIDLAIAEDEVQPRPQPTDDQRRAARILLGLESRPR